MEENKWKIIDIDEEIKKNKELYFEYRKNGWQEQADLILKLTAHMQATRTDIKPMLIPDGCSLI